MLVSKLFQEARGAESQGLKSRGQGGLWAVSCDKESATRRAGGMELRQRVDDKGIVDNKFVVEESIVHSELGVCK